MLWGTPNIVAQNQNSKMRTLLLLIICSISFALKAQIKHDSVSTGAGNADQIWYSLENGEVSSAALSSWHLGFEISGITSSILFNSAAGNHLYVYPNGDTADWDKIDTNGLSTWKACYNADTSWAHGAFNANLRADDAFDLGWGVYNINNHSVVGDSLYVITLANGDARKLWIERLAGGEYFFTSAHLDGSNEVSASIKKDDYKGKNFGYFNLVTGTSTDMEPASKDWDLLFTKYTTQIPVGPGMFLPYGVSGVLANAGTTVSRVHPVDDPETFSDYTSLPKHSSINVIGSNWKRYDFISSKYLIEDSMVHIVETADASIWKVVMTGYGGSSTGQFNFYKELLFTTGTNEIANTSGLLEVFPNPSSVGQQVTVVSTLKGNEQKSLQIVSLQGTVMQSRNIESGLQTTTLSTEELSSGIYFIVVSNGTTSITKKLIVR